MPRSPTVFTLPPGTTPQVPNTVISSAVWNAALDDVAQTFNTVQPLVYGGTGAATAGAAADALSPAAVNVASAATTNIGAAASPNVNITGTTTITAFDTVASGIKRWVTFTGILTLTHNGTSLILPGAANITTAAGDTALFESEGGGNWRGLAYQKASGTAVVGGAATTPKGHIFGLTLSNNGADVTNDIDIAAGEAASDASTPTLITLASSITKRLDAAWAVGTGNGGLDTGSIADTTYFVWLIQRSDTSVVDALFSASATSPTMPANYDRKRRLGAIIRTSGAIRSFVQDGNRFILNIPFLDVDLGTLGTTASTLTLASTPSGLMVFAELAVNCTNGSSSYGVIITSMDQTDATPVHGGRTTFSGLTNDFNGGVMYVRTNTSQQIRARSSVANTILDITVNGWIDSRGQNA